MEPVLAMAGTVSAGEKRRDESKTDRQNNADKKNKENASTTIESARERRRMHTFEDLLAEVGERSLGEHNAGVELDLWKDLLPLWVLLELVANRFADQRLNVNKKKSLESTNIHSCPSKEHFRMDGGRGEFLASASSQCYHR
jgi:hypothetical protein